MSKSKSSSEDVKASFKSPPNQTPNKKSEKKTKIHEIEQTFLQQCKDFSNEQYVPGFKEVFHASHWTVSIIWICLILTFVILTAYFVYQVAAQFLDDPTATTIQRIHYDTYLVPPIYICLTDWTDRKNLLNMNLTEDGIDYLFNLLLIDEYSNFSTEDQFRSGLSDFEEFARRHNLRYFEEAYLVGSTVWDMTFEYVDEDIPCTYFENAHLKGYCEGCRNLSVIFSIPIGYPCFGLKFPNVSAKIGSLATYTFKLKMKTSLAANNMLHIGTEHYRFTRETVLTPYLSDHHYQVEIDADREVTYNRTQRPCSSNNTGDYERNFCLDQCFRDVKVKRKHKCARLLSGETILSPDRSLTFCTEKFHQYLSPNITLSGAKNLTGKKWRKIFVEWYKAALEICSPKCPESCEITNYHYKINEMAHKSRQSKLEFKLIYATKGIHSFEEVPTYSFERTVSDIGGQLGLWLGFSIISVFQILFYFVNLCIDTAKKSKNNKLATS